MTEIRSLAMTIAIGLDDAREIVGAIDVLETLARHRGQGLSSKVREIRAALTDQSADVSPHMLVSTSARNELSLLTFNHDDGLITTNAAAEMLGISSAGVRWHIRAGRLPAHRNGGRWWVHESDIHAILDARRAG